MIVRKSSLAIPQSMLFGTYSDKTINNNYVVIFLYKTISKFKKQHFEKIEFKACVYKMFMQTNWII